MRTCSSGVSYTEPEGSSFSTSSAPPASRTKSTAGLSFQPDVTESSAKGSMPLGLLLPADLVVAALWADVHLMAVQKHRGPDIALALSSGAGSARRKAPGPRPAAERKGPPQSTDRIASSNSWGLFTRRSGSDSASRIGFTHPYVQPTVFNP